jgi:hypothetical protein
MSEFSTLINVSFSDIVANRRKKQLSLFYNEFPTSYDIYLDYGNIRMLAQVVKGTPDGDSFESSMKPFSNKIILPDCPEIKTHDFCDSSTWIHGASNSLFCIYPLPNKVLQMRSSKIRMFKDIVFPSGTSVKFNIFEAIYSNVPAYVAGTKTAFNNGPQWVKVYPPADMDVQEVAIYVCFDGNGVPLFKVSSFTFSNIYDIVSKAIVSQYGDLMLLEFPYYRYGIENLLLHSSKNERVEICLSNDTPLDNGASLVKGEASLLFNSYDEF